VTPEDLLAEVAGELDWLDPPPVFIGGSTIFLFLDAFGSDQLRPTDDVDCILRDVASAAQWALFEEELRSRGWKPDPDGPICRYRSPSGKKVDLMPRRPEALGFAGTWYPAATEHTVLRNLSGVAVRTPTPPLLFACKLEAWQDRGRKEPEVSEDLEDVVALLDGCSGLVEQIEVAEPDLRSWIGAAIREIDADRRLREIALAHLPIAGGRVEREERLLNRLRRLSALAAAQTGEEAVEP